MVEAGDSDGEEAVVFRIAQQTARMLEAQRKRENARRMAKMMRNFKQEQLHNQKTEDSVETQVEVELEDAEALQLRMLQGTKEEIGGRASPKTEQEGGTEPPEPPAKYEAPLVAQLRTLETVEELYQLADVIVPLKTR